jgi:hypothetical protein
MSKAYLFYGLAVLGLTGMGQYSGWTFRRYSEVRDVPRSVRDNPGAYRPIYSGYSRYYGGK